MAFFRAFLVCAFCAVVSLPVWAGGGQQDIFDTGDPESQQTNTRSTSTTRSSTKSTTSKAEDKGTAQTTDKKGKAEKKAANSKKDSGDKTSVAKKLVKIDGTDDSDEEDETGKTKGDKPESDKTNADSDDVSDAKSAYEKAKENEKSFGNRMVSGTSMAATGLGAMQLAEGLSEKSADEDAERDMTAYLETFKCNLNGNGKTYTGGTTGIETPGANQLIKLYQEYVDLAADLKERKTALGMRPGIESEVKLDKANTGLYDNVGRGIENGTYASLYRASKGNENDIQKLEEQKDTASKKVKAGAIAAAGGVALGIGGNILNNYVGKDKDSKNIVDKAKDEIKKGIDGSGEKSDIVDAIKNRAKKALTDSDEEDIDTSYAQISDKDECKQKSDKYLWVQNNKECIPINPCKEGVLEETQRRYCYTEGFQDAHQLDKWIKKFAKESLKTDVAEVSDFKSIGADNTFGVKTKNDNYFVVEVSSSSSFDPIIASAKAYGYDFVYTEKKETNMVLHGRIETEEVCKSIIEFASELSGKQYSFVKYDTTIETSCIFRVDE